MEGCGINDSSVKPKPVKAQHDRLNFSAGSRLTVIDNVLYVMSPEKDGLRVFRLSANGDAFTLVQGVPVFEVDVPFTNNKEASTGSPPLRELKRLMPYMHRSVRKHEEIGVVCC